MPGAKLMITSRLNTNRRLPISEGRDVSTLNFFVTPARGKKDALNTITSTAGVEIVYEVYLVVSRLVSLFNATLESGKLSDGVIV